MPFCPNCRNETHRSYQFCGTCGAALQETVPQQREIGRVQPDLSGDAPYYLSPQRILLMSVLTYGFYLFYWFYLTWKHYRDHTGDEAFPIWHALTLLVPIYGLFRTHAHMRTYKELMNRAGVPTTINPGLAVALVFLSSFLDAVSFNLSGGITSFPEITQTMALGLAALNFISIAIIARLLVNIQGNLNAYWRGMTGGSGEVGKRQVTSARVGVGEIFLSVFGSLLWFDTLATLLSPSYRMMGAA